MIGRLRQLSEPRLRQQAGLENSQTPVERDIFVQWGRKWFSVARTVVIRSIYLGHSMCKMKAIPFLLFLEKYLFAAKLTEFFSHWLVCCRFESVTSCVSNYKTTPLSTIIYIVSELKFTV